MIHLPTGVSWRMAAAGGPDGVYDSGVIDVETPTGSAVDKPPMGRRASDVRAKVQYRRWSGAMEELHSQILDQG